MGEFDYESIEPGYYDKAMTQNAIQRFWHGTKFSLARKEAGDLRGKDILDIACGPGTFLSGLSGYQSATGLDISAKQIAYCKRTHKDKPITWKKADILSISPKKIYDIITALEFIEHLPPERSLDFLRRCHDLLRPGGRLILSTPNFRSLWIPIEFILSRIGPVDYRDQHINPLHPRKLERQLSEAGFSKVRLYTYFLLSPFLAPLSSLLAKGAYSIEKNILRRHKNIMLAVAHKL